MKLLNAGGGTYRDVTYNCIRNRQCQKEFFVPIRQLSDLMFYFDLPGKPESIEVKALNLCCSETGGEFDPDEFSEDFFIGLDEPCEYDGVTSNYVVGQKPDGSWYAVISGITIAVPEGVNLKYFIIKVIATVDEGENFYFSQMMEIEDCDSLTYLQGCYPNNFSGDAEDCNGIYYGFHQGPEEHIGTLNFRYFHWAYVRLGSVKNTKRTLNFTVFNSKKTYRTESTKNKLLEFEIVPDFYADHLFGIFERGDIRVDGVQHRLLEQQDFSTIDTDSNWWVLDVQLTEFCKQIFGCGVSDCTLPPDPDPETCNTPTDVNVEEVPNQTEASATLEPSGNPNLIPDSAVAGFTPNLLDFPDTSLSGIYIAGQNIDGVIFAKVFQIGGAVPSLPHTPAASRIRYKDGSAVIHTLATDLELIASGGLESFRVRVDMPGVLPVDFEEFHDFAFTYNAGTITGGLDYLFSFDGGTPLEAGQQIEYEVLDSLSAIITSGIITEEPLQFTIPQSEDFNLEEICITVRWRKKCSSILFSEWQEKPFGNCP